MSSHIAALQKFLNEPAAAIPKGEVTSDDIDLFILGAQEKVNDHFKAHYPTLKPSVLRAEWLKRFVRIVSNDAGSTEHGSTYALIEIETGLIFKPASFNRPARHARGTIHTPSSGVEFVDIHGPAYMR